MSNINSINDRRYNIYEQISVVSAGLLHQSIIIMCKIHTYITSSFHVSLKARIKSICGYTSAVHENEADIEERTKPPSYQFFHLHEESLQVNSNLINDGTDGNADSREAETGKKASDDRRKLNEEILGAALNSDEKAIKTRSKSSDELTNGAGGGNNGTDKGTDGRETETADESSKFRGELDEESGGRRASNGKSAVNLGADVCEELASSGSTLDVLTNSGDDLTDGHAERRQKTGHEGSNGWAELDEKHVGVLASDDKETLSVRTQVLQEVTDAGSSSDDGAERSANAGQAKAVNKCSDFRRELNKELLGVSAGDSDGLVNLRAKIGDDLASVRRADWSGEDGGRKKGDSSSDGELHFEEY